MSAGAPARGSFPNGRAVETYASGCLLPMRFRMDSPILPDRSDNQEQSGERIPARYLPPPYALRVVAGVITVVTAIIGLVWQLQSHPPPVQPLLAHGLPYRRSLM